MFQRKEWHVLSVLSLIISHGLITLLAIGIATLPVVAQFILFQCWPRVESDSNLLLMTKIGLASVLVIIFNLVKVSRSNRRYVLSAKLASLAYARSNGNWLSRWQERALFKRLPVTRDACVFTVTGFDTFVHKSSRLRLVLETANEIRVMKQIPEYVFALHHSEPVRGLFVLFHMYFLEKWETPSHAEFDFDTRKLVYRDALGQEVERRPFPNPALRYVNAPGEQVTTA